MNPQKQANILEDEYEVREAAGPPRAEHSRNELWLVQNQNVTLGVLLMRWSRLDIMWIKCNLKKELQNI